MNVYIHKPVNYSDMQGPCAEGFHVPLHSEMVGLNTIMTALSLNNGNGWKVNLHMPYAGNRGENGATVRQGTVGDYLTSTGKDPSVADGLVSMVRIASDVFSPSGQTSTGLGLSIRPFKNGFIAPNSSWTVIQGTLGSIGIFRDQTNGLISITDGTNGYTISDKNLGATTVYNDGDTLSEANCGKYYQRGNNYGFPFTGTVTTSSTKVDPSSYGPGNYYSSSTFITTSSNPYSWETVHNPNLRGGETGPVSMKELQNAYIGEYGWKPGANTLLYMPLKSDKSDTQGHITTQGGTVRFGTYGGVECADFTSQGNISVTPFALPSSYTVLVWCNNINGTYVSGYGGRVIDFSTSNPPRFGIAYSSSGYYTFENNSYFNVSTKNKRFLIAAVITNGTGTGYILGDNVNATSTITNASYSATPTGFNIGNEFDNSASRYFLGYISNLIMESKARTQQEISDYYNLTKSNYGL